MEILKKDETMRMVKSKRQHPNLKRLLVKSDSKESIFYPQLVNAKNHDADFVIIS